jgi:hypothetical protein
MKNQEFGIEFVRALAKYSKRFSIDEQLLEFLGWVLSDYGTKESEGA